MLWDKSLSAQHLREFIQVDGAHDAGTLLRNLILERPLAYSNICDCRLRMVSL